jgi:20S proteasome alpha/beta subunit
MIRSSLVQVPPRPAGPPLLPQPLKHLRYPLVSAKGKQMTIAAGFLLRDGLLLCADTLYTDGSTKEYRDKIFPWTGKYAAVAFAISGSDVIGRMVVEDCRDAIASIPKQRITVQDVREAIRPIIKVFQEEYVNKTPFEERDRSRFNLLIGVAVASQPAKLFVTEDAGIKPVDTFDCVGIGRHIALSIIAPAYDLFMRVDRAAILATKVLATTKEHVDGCGGRTQFLAIQNGVMSSIVPHDIEESERQILNYRRLTANLMFSIGDSAITSKEFKERLARFGLNVEHMREKWVSAANPWRDLLASLYTPPEPGDPESTTTDPSNLPPSPESLGGSDES